MNPLNDPAYIAAVVLKYAALVKLTEYATEVLKRTPWLSTLTKERRSVVYPAVALGISAVLVWIPPLFFGSALTAPQVFEQLVATLATWGISQGLVKRSNDLSARASGRVES